MRALIASYDITWLDASPLAVGMYNSLTHSALNNYSPYEVFFGKTSPFVRAPTLPDTPPGRLQEVVKEHNKQIRTMRKVVERLDREYKQKIRNQFQGIEKAFLAGQFIVIENKVPNSTIRRKLKDKYIGPLLIHHVNKFTLIVENIFTGKITTVHKDLAKLLPEKEPGKYDNLIDLAKIKCGKGFTYDQWLDLWAQGKLSDIFKKSAKDLETYGDEGPFPLTCEIGGVELDQSEIPDNLPTDLPADPLTDSEPENEPLDLAQEPPAEPSKRVRFSLPTEKEPNDTTTNEPQTLRRSNRPKRAPKIFNL